MGQFVGELLTSETETHKTIIFFIFHSSNAKWKQIQTKDKLFFFPPFNVIWSLLLFCGTSLEKWEQWTLQKAPLRDA